MNTLIYKRTPKGDPNKEGIFGCHNCMRRVRSWHFDAVIGIGGKSRWPRNEGIALKITWIGIGPRKTQVPAGKETRLEVKFDRFALWDEDGPDVKRLAPSLFRYMFEDQQVRVVMSKSLPREIQEEVTNILRLADNHQSKQQVGFGKKDSDSR